MKLLPKDKEKRVRFALLGGPGNHVFVAGTFNNWNPTANPMNYNPDSLQYKAVVAMPAGTHDYKFIVNGVWTQDPNCKEWTRNCYGSINSVFDL